MVVKNFKRFHLTDPYNQAQKVRIQLQLHILTSVTYSCFYFLNRVWAWNNVWINNKNLKYNQKFNKRIIAWLQLTVLLKVLKQLPPRKIGPRPNRNSFPNPNTNPYLGAIFLRSNCPDTVTVQLNKERLSKDFQRWSVLQLLHKDDKNSLKYICAQVCLWKWYGS